jgi:hypothetical protein
MNLDDLIRDYRANVAAHSQPNDGTKRWVNAVTRASDRLRAIAKQIASSGGDVGAWKFAELIGDPADPTSRWAAIHYLEFMGRESKLVARAEALLDDFSRGESLEAFGIKSWLTDWRNTRNPERPNS